MLEGLSTNRRCESIAACLVAAGQRFVIRYHSARTTQSEKRLNPREAAELARSGLFIASVYQDRARKLEDFGAARGAEDAAAALTYAGQVGQPPGSAVYFAVDEDFSALQVHAVVVPYFRSIARVFAEAGKGTPYLSIGVYGSGLTCRLVGALPLVSFTWLAEATGWRESKTYTAWQVRQHRNTGQTLCSLGVDFQRCEAQDAFGQWQPVGGLLANDQSEGQGELRHVKAEGGNVRWMPSTLFNTPITMLAQGQSVRVLGTSAPGWLRVRATVGGSEVIGHVAASRLEGVALLPALLPAVLPEISPTPPPTLALPPASLRANHPAATRASTSGRAFPIGEAGRPTRDTSAGAATRVAQLQGIADWLAVPSSPRFQRVPGGDTYCNVYATDYATLAGAYLPRVWWTAPALVQIGQGHTPPVQYGVSVREMRADDLYAWLVDAGPAFGWRPVFDATALQATANAGGVGIICADREAQGRAGHITVVVPEDATHGAERDADGNVTQPLQSQAGAKNFRFGSAGKSWWLGTEFRDRGFFVHA